MTSGLGYTFHVTSRHVTSVGVIVVLLLCINNQVTYDNGTKNLQSVSNLLANTRISNRSNTYTLLYVYNHYLSLSSVMLCILIEDNDYPTYRYYKSIMFATCIS